MNLSTSKQTKKNGNDSKFFSTNRKGENHELREELRSPQRDRKRDAVKKVIANMTVGKDVSSLFTDVINCIQTDNLELKKLVYLYLINYAKTQPDLALLAVNTFVKDANDPNPLIRALSIRTMGCIRVEKITEYLCEPLSRCLRDEDPYVRKTAAVCVAKLYDISPVLVEDRGFLDSLRELISDANPTVVSNAIAAISEITENSGRDIININGPVLQKLLAALNECTEWGQVFILDSLSRYNPSDPREAEGIVERVSPRLQHANSAVVMSAVKVILKCMEEISSPETLKSIQKKLAPPLVTLLNSEPEIQYVALRNINLVVQKHPRILENEIKVFFCKYNDPIYVKMEKLEIIIRLVSDRNVDQVLLEFKEYATEVDVDFVRRAVRAIGRCAIKLDRAAERCITVLLDLIQSKVNYVVQEAIIVIKDIFRKYPNKYESIIATLCENLEDLDEPEAKASMIWIIGEYAERIENADELLESFLDSFSEETAQVQLQLLTATVKLFLKQPESTQDMVQRVLNLATEESDNPDLRDRGYIYWRLLSSDPEAARAVVLSEKPEIGDDTYTLEPALLDELLSQISTLASIYHKPPEAFVMKSLQVSSEEEEEEGEEIEIGDVEEESSSPSTSPSASSPTHRSPPPTTSGGGGGGGGGNLLDLLDDPPAPTPSHSAGGGGGGGGLDLFGGSSSTPAIHKVEIVNSAAGHGISIRAAMVRVGGKLSWELDVGNSTAVPVQNLALQFNKNTFSLGPVQPLISLPTPIFNDSVCSVSLPLTINPALQGTDTNLTIQAAIKNTATNAVFYFVIPVSLEALFTPSPMDVNAMIAAWKSVDESQEVSGIVNDIFSQDIEPIKARFSHHSISFIAKRDVPGQEGQQSVSFFSTIVGGVTFLIELKFKTGFNLCKATVRSSNKPQSELCRQSIAKLLTNK